MTKLFTLFTLCLLFVSCSKNNDSDTAEPKTPNIENISNSSANIGEIITINGENFNPNGNYSISFNGTLASITEVTSTYIKVKIPQGATSGDIILSYNESTIFVGSITINSSTLYVYEEDSSSDLKQIVEINKEDGSTKLIASLNVASDWNLVFDASSNQIIGMHELASNVAKRSLLLINIDDGISSTVNLEHTTENSSFYELIIGNDNKLYGYEEDRSADLKQIVEINKLDGTTKLIASLNVESDWNLVFDISSNQIIGMHEYPNSNNSLSQSLLLINIIDGTSSTINLEYANEYSWFSELVIK